MPRLTTDQAQSLVERYLAGESTGKLAREFGVSDVALLRRLKNQGVVRRDASLARRQYPLWDAAFDVLTPEAAYWIGFLMADGCVHDETKVTLGLAEKDRGHIEKLRAFLRSPERPIQHVPQNGSCALKIHSRQIVDALVKHGVTPRKSLTAKAGPEVQGLPAFWLGVLDGDGSLEPQKKRVRFFGTADLADQFVGFLVQQNIKGKAKRVRLKIHVRKDGIAEVGLLGERAKNLLRLLYRASPVHLDRKYQLALAILEDENEDRTDHQSRLLS
jgi:hypothetical protein